MKKFRVLIPTFKRDIAKLHSLLQNFVRQCEINPEFANRFNAILCDDKEGEDNSIGAKRNKLLQLALQDGADYVAFVDSDDRVADDYLLKIFTAIDNFEPDCCSLTGIFTVDGTMPRTFIHNTQYPKYYEENNVFYRPFNHLNTVKIDIAIQFKFPHENFGEDYDWAMQVYNSGLLKKQAEIEGVLYYYDYISNK